MVTQIAIARKCGLDVSTVNKILHQKPGTIFRKDTIQRVFKIARELGFKLDGLVYRHRRRHPRREVECPISVTIYRPDGSVFSSGKATLREVSLSGAILKGIVLSKQVIPIDPHTIGLRRAPASPSDLEVRGRPLRFFHGEEGLGLSIEFVETAGVRKWIRRLS